MYFRWLGIILNRLFNDLLVQSGLYCSNGRTAFKQEKLQLLEQYLVRHLKNEDDPKFDLIGTDAAGIGMVL
jgi:hypothetical protein